MRKERIDADLISKYMTHNNLSIKKFCEQSKISLTTYHKIMKREKVTIPTICKIFQAINLPLSLFLPFTSD